DPDEILPALALTEEETGMAVDELEELGWIQRHRHKTRRSGVSTISPRPSLFFALDPLVKGWNPKEDARSVAAAVINSGNESLSWKALDDIFGWGPRRINPAAYYLHEHQLAVCLQVKGIEPYAFLSLRITPKSRRFVTD